MILESFTVENWSCIRRVEVAALPETGVVVLHGPNGTGKSSIVAALRAALMDFAADSKNAKLTRWFPADGEPPRVTVGFRAGDSGYRLTKTFKKNGECRLERRSAAGWELMTKTPAEVHDEAQRLCGQDSRGGLYQLLWLDQATFELPDAKKFDADVQANLRRVLGVMQTPLDDAFIQKVRANREKWFSARTKAGEPAKFKPKCRLSEDLERLDRYRVELAGHETRHTEMRQALRRAEYLEGQIVTLNRNVASQADVVARLRTEAEQGHQRRSGFALAQQRAAAADTALKSATTAREERNDLEARIAAAQQAADRAQSTVNVARERLQTAESELQTLRERLNERKEELRAARARLSDAEQHERLEAQQRAADELKGTIRQAEELDQEITTAKNRAITEPTPTDQELKDLQGNRTNAEKLRAELDAAAMQLTIERHDGAGTLTVDDGAAADVPAGANTHRVRRGAELTIPGWGRIGLQRGADGRSLDEVAMELNELDRQFARGLAPFAVPPTEADPLTALRERTAERKARQPMLKKSQIEFEHIAPDGIGKLRENLTRFQNEIRALTAIPVATDASNASAEKVIVGQRQSAVEAVETLVNKAQGTIDRPETGFRALADSGNHALTTAATTVTVMVDQLGRLASAEDLQTAVAAAEREVAAANLALREAQLTDDEATVPERQQQAEASALNLSEQLDRAKQDFHQLQGRLSAFAGLHQARAEAAARVELLESETTREQLEARAFDLLYQLFEESREKQMGAVVGPIANRIGRWLQLAGIGDYRGIECNDAFLPDRLTSRAGSLSLEQESTGTYEQVALMARLALGAVLAKPGEPSVAVLDDPLTHSDAMRLSRMRAVLRSAAKGDVASTPPAGPLQILVFTCHPEWFNADAARVVDLGDPVVLQRATN